MRSILVATDGSDGARAAMRWAGAAAEATGAPLTAMTAFDPVESELPPARSDHLRAELARELDAWVDAAGVGEHVTDRVVETGDPRDAIPAVASRLDADLVVVGRVGESAGPGFLHLRSVPEFLVHHSNLPLAVVGGEGELPNRRVLVATDGSEKADAALRWAAGYARDCAAELVTVGVAAPDDPTSREVAVARRSTQQEELERRVRDEWSGPAVEAEVEFEPVAVIDDDVAEGILATARARSSDVIVLGMRGLGGFVGLRVGRVALRTLHRADRTVVLVPPDA